MVDRDDPLDWRFAFVLAVPNVGVVGVWALTATSEWFLRTEDLGPVYFLTILGGTLASLFGSAVSVVGLCGPPRDRPCRLASLAVNAAGLAADFAGFIVYVGPGC